MKQFVISTIFNAVNQLTGPVQQMGRQINQFAALTRNASSQANSALNGVGTTAGHTVQNLNRINNINFNSAIFKLNNLKGHIKDLSQNFNNIGNAAIGAGMSGGAVGFATYKSLDPVREYQSVRNSLGTLYSKPGASDADVYAAGEREYKKTQDMALHLPGEVADFAYARKMTKNFGVEGTEGLLKGLTDLTGAAGIKFNREFVQALQQGASGNDVDALKGLGITFGSEKGHTKITDLNDGNKEIVFKNPGDVIKWLSLRGSTKYKGGTDRAMQSAEGKESNVVDAFKAQQVSAWKDTGALDLYTRKLDELTAGINKAGTVLNPVIKSVTNFANANDKLFNGLVLGVPALLGIGVAAKAIGFALSGLSMTVGVATSAFKVLRIVSLGTFNVLRVVSLAALSPIGIAITALGVAGYMLYKNWDDVVSGSKLLWNDLKTVVSGFCTDTLTYFTSLYDSAVQTASSWIELGSNFIKNLWTGVTSQWGSFKTWLLDELKNLVTSIPVIGGNLAAKIPNSTLPLSNSKSTPNQQESSFLTNAAPNVYVNQENTHYVSDVGVRTISKNNAKNGRAYINVGQSRRTAHAK